MNEPITFKLDRERKFQFTQRSKFRMSQAGLTEADYNNPTKGFYAICVTLHALCVDKNFAMTFEDIAVAIEGREEEAAQMISDCMKGIAGDSDPNDSGSTTTGGSESTSA